MDHSSDQSPEIASRDFKDAVVVITGGTGSLGRALTRRLLAATENAPRVIRIVSRDELKQAQLATEYPRESQPGGRLRLLLGDVRDRERLATAFSGADIVIHAAALKRIDSIEYSPGEGIATNILGTMNVVNAAREQRVRVVVVLSSDKAVAPANLYGATKMVAERYTIAANSYVGSADVRLVAVRYGNVLASRGSIVEIMLRARDRGEAIPITDGSMTRFWLTLDQAVDTVLYAVRESACGRIFIPAMRASSLELLKRVVAPDAQTLPIPARIGEKWHETVIAGGEDAYATGDGYFVLGARASGVAHGWKRLSDGFEYRSDMAEQYTEETLHQVLLTAGILQ